MCAICLYARGLPEPSRHHSWPFCTAARSAFTRWFTGPGGASRQPDREAAVAVDGLHALHRVQPRGPAGLHAAHLPEAAHGGCRVAQGLRPTEVLAASDGPEYKTYMPVKGYHCPCQKDGRSAPAPPPLVLLPCVSCHSEAGPCAVYTDAHTCRLACACWCSAATWTALCRWWAHGAGWRHCGSRCG